MIEGRGRFHDSPPNEMAGTRGGIAGRASFHECPSNKHVTYVVTTVESVAAPTDAALARVAI